VKIRLNEAVLSLLITSVILVILEIFTSTLLPLFGIVGYRFAFNIIIVLFLSLRMQSAALPFFILFTQFLHSLFSIEGWALGTFIGIMISGLVSYVKDKLEFGSFLTTIILVQLFQFVWFILASTLICLKIGDFSRYFDYIIEFFPETFLLSLFAPILFKLLARIWKLDSNPEGVSL
jgi:hypothetical protein